MCSSDNSNNSDDDLFFQDNMGKSAAEMWRISIKILLK